MPFDLAQALRMKGMIDRALRDAPDSVTGVPGLTQAYMNARKVCLGLVSDTDVQDEFEALFPEVEVLEAAVTHNPMMLGAAGERARLLLAALGGWLASWPSAEQLLAELTTALETAEARTDEPEQKARFRNTLEGLEGAGRQVAIDVIAAYLARVPL